MPTPRRARVLKGPFKGPFPKAQRSRPIYMISAAGHRMLVTVSTGDRVSYRGKCGTITAFDPAACEVCVKRDDGEHWSWPIARVKVIASRVDRVERALRAHAAARKPRKKAGGAL